MANGLEIKQPKKTVTEEEYRLLDLEDTFVMR